MTSETETCRTSDGITLARRTWRPDNAWATVVLVHGLGEHSGRYEHVGDRFARDGLAVIAPDQRGFGRSGGPRAWVDRWEQLYDDLELHVRDARSAAPERPLVLYGHSLGGLIALGYVLDGRMTPDALVLSAPALASAIPGWKKTLALLVSRVRPKAMIANGLDPSHLSKDPQVASAYVADPLNVHRSTAHYGAEALHAQSRIGARLDVLSIPTLVVHGEDDRIVPESASALLEGLPGVTRRVYPGVRHELHNDIEAAAVLDDVVAWIRATIGRARPAQAVTAHG